MKIFLLAIFIVGLLAVCAEKARFDNYRVYSVSIENEEQLKVLHELELHPDGITFMESPVAVGQMIDLVVPPHKFADIAELLKTYKIKYWIKIKNVQELIDNEQTQTMGSVEDYGWKNYYNLEATYKWLDQLLTKYPKVLTNYNYGKSFEGRQLRAVKVSHKEGNPTIFIESTIHAREWITVATSTYFLNELLTSNNTDIRNLADNYDWVIVPVTNVDGYEYSHNSNRMWRKTRQPHSVLKFCVGTDANRNFGFHHREAGASKIPCLPTYAGPHPFSEPETLALSEFIKTFKNLKLYLSFHSFSQLLLFPYGHTTDHARNHNDMNRISLKTKEAIAKRYGTKYTVGNIAETIYLASGSSIDWVYGTQNVSLTYTFEFRDKGRYGFLLPADQIIPNALEVIDGIVAMTNEAKTLNYL